MSRTTTSASDLPPTQSRISRLLRTVGGASASRRGPSRGQSHFETLENRVLLGGDHPSFELPLTPTSGTEIVIDMTGAGSVSGVIEDTTPELFDDLFRFEAPADDFVRVWADTVNPGSNLDSRVEIYNLAGEVIATGSSQGRLTSGTFDDGWAGFVAEAGVTYFVRVLSDQSMGPRATGEYEIRVNTLSEELTVQENPTPPPGQPRYGYGEVEDEVTLVGGDKMYVLTVPSAAAFDSLATFYATNDLSPFDPRLDVYDEQGRLIRGNSETGRLNAAFLGVRSAPEMTFYLRVRGDVFDPSSIESTGTFILKADTRAAPVAVDPVVRRGVTTGAIPDGYDTRLFTFQSQGTGLHFVTVRGIPLPPLADPAIRLYNDAGVEIGFDRIGAELQIQLIGGETYFFVVEEFDLGNGGVFAAWLEAHHTFSASQERDDHASTPPDFEPGQATDEHRRIFESATPVIWSDPHLIKVNEPAVPGQIFPFQDPNPLGDRSYVVTGTATGRIHQAADTDLFQFVPPMDMLGGYAGNNDDAGDGLFIGTSGAMTLKATGDAPGYEPITENFLGIWDAMAYWEVQAGVSATVRSMTEWDWGGSRDALVIGGEFTSANYNLTPFIAAYWYNDLTGLFEFADLTNSGMGLNDVVHALHTFDFDFSDEDLEGDSLLAGGAFTNLGQHVGRYTVDFPQLGPGAGGSWKPMPGLDDVVYAFTDFDSPDPEMGGITLDRYVVAGGEFGVQWLWTAEDPSSSDILWENVYTDIVPGLNTNGPVYALAEYDPFPDDEEVFPELVIGGDFSSFGGLGVRNIFSLTLDPEGSGGFGDVILNGMGAGLGGLNDIVYALTIWDRDGEGEQESPELIAGGAFTNVGGATGVQLGRVASWDGDAWAPLGLPPMGVPPGFNNTVRTLISFTDSEYGVGLGPYDENPVLYAGGDFTIADGRDALRVSMLEYNALAEDWEWLAMGGGVTDTVYALQNFNDEIPGAWDRKDRRNTRLSIVVNPTHGGFEDTYIRVFDSNFNLLYENDTIAFPFPDPSGMVDPSLTAPDADLGDIMGINVWGGEVYYLEVSSVTGTGRYNISIRADAYPPNTFGGFARDDVISSYSEPVGLPGLPESVFAQASPINLADMTTGDGRNYIPPNDAAHNVRVFEPTPSGFQIVQWSELAVIHNITDYDVYRFRAPASGAIEIRTATHQIEDEFYEEITNLRTGAVTSTQLTKRLNSPLDSKISVYDNDFILLASNDDNPAFAGELSQQIMGSFGVTEGEPRIFRSHDARVVIPIVSGDTYFIVVESGQYASFLADPSEVDWRRATGGYELLLNAVPQLEFDDDHVDFIPGAPETLTGGTVIPINAATGAGSITGEIRTRLGSSVADNDVFVVQAVGRGTMTIRVGPTSGSAITPTVRVFDSEANLVANASAPSGGEARVDFTTGRGDLFYVVVDGAASQGNYVVNVQSPPFVDDHASTNWHLATELIIRDFLGTAEQSGSIEAAGDIDLFRFETPDYDFAELLVESRSTGFRPHVRVFEVSEDPSGNPVMLQIAESMGAPHAATSFSLTGPERTSLATGETYNNYYVAVSGVDPTADRGDYRIRLEVTPTDDHPDEGEFEFATPIIIDTITGEGVATGDLEIPEDSDLFVFQAAASGQSSVTVTATSDLRPTLLIIDQSFNPVEHLTLGTTTPIAGEDELGSSANYVFNVVRGQQYYVLINGLFGGAETTGIGTYRIDVIAPIVDDHPNEGEFHLASEIILSQITGAGGVSATIAPQLDTDLFFFRTLAASSPSEPGAHRIVLDSRAGGFDPILTVYDETQTPIDVITDGSALDEDPTVGVIRYTVQSVARNEIFFILVDADDSGDPVTGAYSLDIIGPPPGLPDPNPNDDHANAGQWVAATVIPLDQRTGAGRESGIIEISGDTDLFRFDAITEGQAFVQVVTPSGALLDTRLTIFERRGLTEFVAIASDTVGIPGANSFTSFNTVAAGTEYYMLVEDVSDGRGAYSVEIATEPETFYLYFPEGFAGDQIREYISFANPHQSNTVTYDIVLYYENPALTPARIVSGGMLAPGARGGVTISDAGTVFSPAVLTNEPYAIVIESDGMLGATFSHYDFGAAIGESFTAQTSDQWTFARVERNPGGVEDFLVYYNPNNHDVTVTLTAYGATGAPVTLQQTVGANRRGGWAVDDLNQLPLGVFSARLSSEAASTIEPGDRHIGIVASLSHFNVAGGSAFAVLGDPGAGATVSVVPRIQRGDGVNAEVTIFNPGSTPTSVIITGSYTQAAFEDLRRDVVVQGNSFVTLSGADLGLIRNQPLGLRFESVRPITVTAVQTEKGDTTAIQAVSDSATTWFFGDAFINRTTAGQDYFETLSIYNPARTSIAVDIKLYFNNGSSIITTINVGADSFTELRLHEFSPLLARPQSLNFFSIELDSPSPFIVQMDHFDLFLDGGWGASGAPFGLLNPLSRIS